MLLFPLHRKQYNFKFSKKKQKIMKKDIDKSLTPQITKRMETTENLQTKLTLQDQQSIFQEVTLNQRIRESQLRRYQDSVRNLFEHAPSSSDSSAGFKQQWQNTPKVSQGSDQDILIFRNNCQALLSFVTMVCFSLTIWLANVEFFFSFNCRSFISSLIYILPLVLLAADWAVNLNPAPSGFQQTLYRAVKPLLCIFYFFLKIFEVQMSHEGCWLLLELPCLWFLHERASYFYKSFRFMSLSKKYEYEFKAFDLIFSLMQVGHIVAIILYLITLCGQTTTWSQNFDFQHESCLIRYIYSFYFGCTTILTVGYGDIVPKNHIEIAVVCLIELFGIAIFAYLINQIGYNLSSRRKDREIVERDLSVLQKCRQFYKLDQKLIVKARGSLLSSNEAVNRLKPEEEHSLALKFNQQLRKELTESSTLNVVKSCIFLLCRWSKQFQTSVAQSLVSSLYLPGQPLLQLPGNERIYIVKLGKLNFYLKQRGNKQQAQKVIKSLKVDLSTEVSNNSFGYTAVIGKKQTELQAISQEFTSVYYMDKEHFYRCLQENPKDHQYLTEIKHKIELSRFPEALELPTLAQSKYHYSPSRFFVIKKMVLRDTQLSNKRTAFRRVLRKNSTVNLRKEELKEDEEMVQVRSAYINSMEQLSAASQNTNNQTNTISVTNEHTLVKRSPSSLCWGTTSKGIQPKLLECYDAGKQFSNYFPLQNLGQVLLKQQKNTPLLKISHKSAKKNLKKSKFSLLKM